MVMLLQERSAAVIIPRQKTLPIISMTSNAFVDDIRAAIESGMDAHIAKPIQLDKPEDTIQQVFDKRKQQEISEGENDS